MSFFWSDASADTGMGLRYQIVRRDPNVNNRLWMEMWYEDGYGNNFAINRHNTDEIVATDGIEIHDSPVYCDGKVHKIIGPDGTTHTFTGFKEFICNAMLGYTSVSNEALNKDYYNSVVTTCRISAVRDAQWLDNINDCLVYFGYYPVERPGEMYYVYENI